MVASILAHRLCLGNNDTFPRWIVSFKETKQDLYILHDCQISIFINNQYNLSPMKQIHVTEFCENSGMNGVVDLLLLLFESVVQLALIFLLQAET